MKELIKEQKAEIAGEYLKNATGNDLLNISKILIIKLGEYSIESNTEVLEISTSMQPDGVAERRDVALILFQVKHSKNKVDDLPALLQTAPELLEALQQLTDGIRKRGFAGHFSDYLKHSDTVINKALGKEDEE